MAFNISIPAKYLDGSAPEAVPQQTNNYISRQFHEKNAFARIENWYEDIKDFTFRTVFVPLTRDQAVSITRYYEELRLRSAIRDQDRRESGEKVEEWGESLYDVDFREEMFTFMMADWPEEWRNKLNTIKTNLDQAIATFENGAFVKLSNRSPKDSALYTRFMRDYVRDAIAKSPYQPGTPEAINEDVWLFSQAGWLATRCTNGEEALKLILMSERVHLDLHAHMLVLGEDEDNFNLNLVVREWCPDLNPMWEFRAFVVDSQLNACTIYSDFSYVAEIAENRDRIERMIVECWESCRHQIRPTGYTIDFFVLPDLSAVKVIEINALPPIAGTGLFDWRDEADKKIINEGPFTFRVHMHPVESLERAMETTDKTGSKVRVIRTLPAPLKHLLDTCRGPAPAEAASNSTCIVS